MVSSEDWFKDAAQDAARRIRENEVRSTDPLKQLMDDANEAGLFERYPALRDAMLDLYQVVSDHQDDVSHSWYADRVQQLSTWFDQS